MRLSCIKSSLRVKMENIAIKNSSFSLIATYFWTAADLLRLGCRSKIWRKAKLWLDASRRSETEAANKKLRLESRSMAAFKRKPFEKTNEYGQRAIIFSEQNVRKIWHVCQLLFSSRLTRPRPRKNIEAVTQRRLQVEQSLLFEGKLSQRRQRTSQNFQSCELQQLRQL